ncbi:MAG: type II toxin-antitoxin system HicB family antitoxin [Dehalococcoidia bacterium]|nr:type II toxin-antitoxin system HicB family antitoxin [Dehalococcoidia bacterium]
MLLEYVEKALSKAVYKKLRDNTYSGSIPDCPGTVAFATTLYQCQQELRSVLEGWLIVKIRHGDPLPVMDGLDLNKSMPKERKAPLHA